MERYIVNIYDKKPQPGESKKAIIVPFSPDSKVQEFIAEVKRRSIENRSMKNWECISMFLSAYDGPFMYSGDTMRNVVLDSTKEEIWAYVAKNCPCARLVKCGGEHADEPSDAAHDATEPVEDEYRVFVAPPVHDKDLMEAYIRQTPPDIVRAFLAYKKREDELQPLLETLEGDGPAGSFIAGAAFRSLMNVMKLYDINQLEPFHKVMTDLVAGKLKVPDWSEEELQGYFGEYGPSSWIDILEKVEGAEEGEETEEAEE